MKEKDAASDENLENVSIYSNSLDTTWSEKVDVIDLPPLALALLVDDKDMITTLLTLLVESAEEEASKVDRLGLLGVPYNLSSSD